MSLTLLLEKYDVSTEEGLQKALNEIEKEEAEVDEALSNALGKACSLEGRLRTASQAYTKLGEMKNDALAAADMVQRTAELAQDVSAKVRQLDLARTRVAECQRRVHDLIDLQLCSSGVEAAIKAHDLEAGAAHVARYLSMEPASLAAARARGALDPARDMTIAADKLMQLLTDKFEEAARKDDAAGVERVAKLFPVVGRADSGAQLYARHLVAKLEASLPALCSVTGDAEACVYADAFTRVLEAAAAAVRKLQGSLPAIKILQPVVCSGARRVMSAAVAARRVGAVRGAAAAATPELALMHRTLQLYLSFLRSSVTNALASSPADVKKSTLEELEKMISSSDLTRLAQDILGHYLTLEKYHLEDNVAKAIKMFQTQGDEESSLVDDVFFIAKRVITRAISTCSVEAVCVVLNECGDVLTRSAAPPLAPPAAARVTSLLPPPPPAPQAAALPPHVASRMSEAETGASWAEQLAADACAAAAPLAPLPHDKEKIASCASGLSGAAASFRAIADSYCSLLLQASAASCQAWCEALLDTDEADVEDDCAAEALPLALGSAASAVAALPPRPARALPAALLTDILTRVERALLHTHYTQKSGLILERRARRLAAWAGTNAPSARDRCARFTQICALLSLEQVSHCQHALSPHTTLTPGFIKDVLARRTDFKIEDIKRLKL